MVIVIILCVRHLNYTENPFEGKAKRPCAQAKRPCAQALYHENIDGGEWSTSCRGLSALTVRAPVSSGSQNLAGRSNIGTSSCPRRQLNPG